MWKCGANPIDSRNIILALRWARGGEFRTYGWKYEDPERSNLQSQVSGHVFSNSTKTISAISEMQSDLPPRFCLCLPSLTTAAGPVEMRSPGCGRCLDTCFLPNGNHHVWLRLGVLLCNSDDASPKSPKLGPFLVPLWLLSLINKPRMWWLFEAHPALCLAWNQRKKLSYPHRKMETYFTSRLEAREA